MSRARASVWRPWRRLFGGRSNAPPRRSVGQTSMLRTARPEVGAASDSGDARCPGRAPVLSIVWTRSGAASSADGKSVLQAGRMGLGALADSHGAACTPPCARIRSSPSVGPSACRSLGPSVCRFGGRAVARSATGMVGRSGGRTARPFGRELGLLVKRAGRRAGGRSGGTAAGQSGRLSLGLSWSRGRTVGLSVGGGSATRALGRCGRSGVALAPSPATGDADGRGAFAKCEISCTPALPDLKRGSSGVQSGQATVSSPKRCLGAALRDAWHSRLGGGVGQCCGAWVRPHPGCDRPKLGWVTRLGLGSTRCGLRSAKFWNAVDQIWAGLDQACAVFGQTWAAFGQIWAGFDRSCAGFDRKWARLLPHRCLAKIWGVWSNGEC